VETVHRIDEVDAAAWDATVARARLPVFYSHGFLRAYERHPLAPTDDVAYLTVHGADGPVAVLPAYLPRETDPLGCLYRAYPEADGERALLTHNWHCYDGTVPGGPGAAQAVVDELRRLARELGVPWCGVVNVRADGPTAAALTEAGLPLRPLSQRFMADLDGVAQVDDLLARGRPRAGVNLRRHRRRAAEFGTRCEVLSPSQADLEGLMRMCDALAVKYGSHRFYPAGVFERFVAELPDGSAVVLQVHQHDRLVAASVCLLDEWNFHWWAGGVDYRVEGNFSPYAMLFAWTLEQSLLSGRPKLEGGRGNPTFKTRHGLTSRRLDACLVPA
jgi:predicted N-acyltransferase